MHLIFEGFDFTDVSTSMAEGHVSNDGRPAAGCDVMWWNSWVSDHLQLQVYLVRMPKRSKHKQHKRSRRKRKRRRSKCNKRSRLHRRQQLLLPQLQQHKEPALWTLRNALDVVLLFRGSDTQFLMASQLLNFHVKPPWIKWYNGRRCLKTVMIPQTSYATTLIASVFFLLYPFVLNFHVAWFTPILQELHRRERACWVWLFIASIGFAWPRGRVYQRYSQFGLTSRLCRLSCFGQWTTPTKRVVICCDKRTINFNGLSLYFSSSEHTILGCPCHRRSLQLRSRMFFCFWLDVENPWHLLGKRSANARLFNLPFPW